MVFSQDVGVHKPDPLVFLRACERAGCSPSELIHAGDSLETDVAGAHGVGAVSVWLNRAADRNGTGVLPHYEIQSLGELVAIVEGM